MKTVIANVKLVQDGCITPCDIVLNDDRIESIEAPGSVNLPGIDAQGLYLSHGFIDIHCHGGGGCR